ncbi:hypothetical protein BDV30DRAFT_235947 [Aspergillus minisclerotigenes]|uniref:Uncharacterized protein n=1 Tax=Aspergillus minisclerotigenes TaxID=656917 RepID=A0A5N6JBR9_9EURO|nr:hypothetical protein BDV30DRAFT_235947 [Aspergillus minisclerotigenes]
MDAAGICRPCRQHCHSGEGGRYESQFYRPEDGEAYRLQVYSTTPIQPEELNKLYEYLCFDLSQRPFLEIYSYNPPDGLACVEHQRREVAHRKRLQAEQLDGEYDESLPPLIPTMQTGFEDQFMSGFCFLLTSKSYLQGSFRDNDHGTGPSWISFDRSLPSASEQILEQQRQMIEGQSVDLNVLHLTWGPERKTVTVTNYSLDSEYDLQYVIYVQFLADIEQDKTALLETTARTFTAGIISHLPASKTIYFEFWIPGSSSLSSLVSAPPNGFDVGASHEFEPGTTMRALPLINRDFSIRPLPHHFFTVVLDKPSFIQEPGVLLYTL